MNFVKLAPAGPQPGPRRGWTLAASVFLHALAFALLIGIAARHRQEEPPAAPAYDLVFQGPTPEQQQQAPALPPAQPADVPVPDDALPGSPAPPPTSAPDPNGAPSAAPEQAASSPAELQAPEAPPAATTAPAPLAFAEPAPQPETTPPPPPIEAQTPPEPPTIRLELPPTTEPAEQMADIMPHPPPPVPQPAPRPAPPRPRPAPRAAPGTLANPTDLSFTSAAAPPPRPAARGSVASRAINLAIGTPSQTPDRSNPAGATRDWFGAVYAYWLAHRYYPRLAADNGQDGTVVIQMSVSPAGKVVSVEVVSPSGSQWLDMAAIGTFRGAQLPPPPDLGPTGTYVQQIPINYYLIRR